MSLDKFNQLVTATVKSIDDNHKLSTTALTIKLAHAIEVAPHDKTLGQLYRVVEKMSENGTDLIRRADFRNLYNKLFSYGTEAAEIFAEELGITPAASPVTYKERDDSAELPAYEIGDQILANALNSAVDKDTPLKTYAQSTANRALKIVANALELWNLNPQHLSVGSGNEKFIIVKADYDTPKGLTSFYVPVEVVRSDVKEASVFMGNTGPQDLNNTNIRNYITSNAGSQLKIGSEIVLGVLSSTISEAELALARFNNSSYGTSSFFANSSEGQKIVNAAASEMETTSDEFESFEKKFESPLGIASWNFGEEKVSAAHRHLARELASFGHSHPQMKLAKSDETTLFYAVSLNGGRVAFTVPVKFANGTMIKPNVLLCNGSVKTFDKAGINELVSENASDIRVAAVSSAMASLKPSEIINNIREAVLEGNLVKAEDALNVLAHGGDEKAYASGFAIYKSALAGVKPAEETKCSALVKSAVSEHPICSHTGLPAHKVYQDDHGNCRPLYRRGMSETYEGASFMNAKIFLG